MLKNSFDPPLYTQPQHSASLSMKHAFSVIMSRVALIWVFVLVKVSISFSIQFILGCSSFQVVPKLIGIVT
jgi:hypothetical protein